MQQLIFSLLLYIFSAANFAFAVDVSSAEKMTARLDVLTSDNSILPKDILKEVEQHILLSEQNNWPVVNIQAQTLKAELLALLEDLPAAENIVKQVLPQAQKAELNWLAVRLQLVMLGIQDSKGYNAEVEQHIAALLSTAENWDEPLGVGGIYNAVGHSYLMHGLLDKSLIYLRKAYNIFTEINDQANLSYALNSLANLYSDLGDDETAVQYLLESLAINKSLNDQLSESIVAHNIGTTYLKMGNYPLAQTYLEESLKVAVAIDDKIGIVWAQNAMANVYNKQEQPEKALALLDKTIATFEQTGDNRELFNARLAMFDSYLLLDDIERASEQIPLLNSLQAQLNNSAYQLELDKREAELYFFKGDYQSAYQALLQYNNNTVQQHNKEKQQNLQNLKISFDVEIKENQNEILQKENEVQQLKLKQQNKEQIISFIVVGFAITVTVFACYLLFQQTRSRNKFKSLALHDHLTEAPNRRAILNEAEKAYHECKIGQNTASLAIVDLDKFKAINDTYGHDIGDEVLKAFANACKSSIRKHDHFGRYGGEEWLLVLSDTNNGDIQRIFSRLHQTLNAGNFSQIPASLTINFSVGVTTMSRDRHLSLQQYISETDQFLYQAKNNGRNQIHFGDTYFKLPT